MQVLEGKAAIVTGSARGIGRATAELLCAHGARVLVNDIDADQAARGRGRDRRRHGRLQRRPHSGRRLRGSRRQGRRRVRAARHRREQCGLHVGWDRPQDDRRAIPRDARDPHRRPLPRPPRGSSVFPRAREEGARGWPRGVPQGRERHVDLGHPGKRRSGELLGGEGGTRGHHEDARPRVGPVQGERERRRLRVRRDPTHGFVRGRRRDVHSRGRRDSARNPRAKS